MYGKAAAEGRPAASSLRDSWRSRADTAAGPARCVFLNPKRSSRYGTVSENETQEGGQMAARPPRPGVPVRGSTTGRPVMAALDLLGRRWALRILWELRDGPLGARALRERCDEMSPSVLYERLAGLTNARLLTRDENGEYLLTELGAGLGAALEPLDAWARNWSRQIAAGPPPAR